jgi:PAS domain S-box-containing protein
MIVCFAIFIVYMNNAPQPTSFLIKLVGIPLAAIMVTIGFIASSLLPLVNETLADQYRRKVELVRIALVSSNYNRLPHDAVYVLPVSVGPSNLQYMNPSLSSSQLLERLSQTEDTGPLLEEDNPDYDHFYLNIRDPGSFIIQYSLSHNGVSYWVGFSYASLRLSVHKFWIKFIPIVFGVTLFMLIVFPLVLHKGVLTPLKNLLEAVHQVEGGNYHLSLSVTSEDEVGQLAHGYNSMVEALRNAESNFKALTENANDAILILLKNGSVAYANIKAMEISGFNHVEILQKNFRELIHPSHLAKVEKYFTARIEGGTAPQCYETRIIDKKGCTVPVEITGAGTFWHENPATVVILRDIEDRKKAEELLRIQTQQLLQADKLSSIGALVAGVAHEVNNPNQVISLNAHFLSEGLPSIFTLAETDEELDDSLKIAGMVYEEFRQASESAIVEISSSTKRISHIINELKSFVRERVEQEKKLIDINELINSVMDLSRHFIRTSTDHFKLVPGNMIPNIKADNIRLEQVILNLIQNACQSLSDKSKSIIVSTKYDRIKKMVSIEVRDEGKGITSQNLPRITDPFFTTKRETGGTGLGLSISKHIINDLGGSLNFQSRVGEGTTVTVSLPQADQDNDYNL